MWMCVWMCTATLYMYIYGACTRQHQLNSNKNLNVCNAHATWNKWFVSFSAAIIHCLMSSFRRAMFILCMCIIYYYVYVYGSITLYFSLSFEWRYLQLLHMYIYSNRHLVFNNILPIILILVHELRSKMCALAVPRK